MRHIGTGSVQGCLLLLVNNIVTMWPPNYRIGPKCNMQVS